VNKVIILCAPSGSGKTTIVKHLLSIDNRLEFSVSACTRKQRLNEIHGKDYYFLTHEDFAAKVANNQFLEYEEVYGGNFYGTLKSEVDRIWLEGKAVLFDVDVEGGLNIKQYFGGNALAIFVKPPSIAILEQRLRYRSTETEETLRMRVNKAVHELVYESKFEHILLNKDLETALSEAEELISEVRNNSLLVYNNGNYPKTCLGANSIGRRHAKMLSYDLCFDENNKQTLLHEYSYSKRQLLELIAKSQQILKDNNEYPETKGVINSAIAQLICKVLVQKFNFCYLIKTGLEIQIPNIF
jgi:guanylate kinase